MGNIPEMVLEICKLTAEDTILSRKPPFFIAAHPDTGLTPVINQPFETPYGLCFLTVHEKVANSGEINGISESLYHYKLTWYGLRP